MFKNYLKVALRSLLRHKGYTFINIFGLTVGLCAALLILLYAESELTYDRFHSKADNIYMVYKERVTPTGTQETFDTWAPTWEALKEDYSQIVNGARVLEQGLWVEVNGERFNESTTLTDPSYFELFDFELKEGNQESILSDLNQAVVSQELADRLFPGANAMGKTIEIPSLENQYIISGILADVPYNSYLQPNLVIRVQSHPQFEGIAGNWGGSFLESYVQLEPQANVAQLESSFEDFITKIWDAQTAETTNFKLLNMLDIYNRFNDNRQYAYILLFVAIGILLIAAINFMNLATARSMERSREAGMRKVLGALRPQLIVQYLTESMAITFISLILGLFLAVSLLPMFNAYYSVGLDVNFWQEPMHLSAIIGIGVFIGLCSGLYPAFYLTSLKSVDTLKGKVVKSNAMGKFVRNGLVVLQFMFSTLLIVGTLVVGKQVNYMKNKDMAFDKENLLVLPIRVDDFPSEEQGVNQLAALRNTLRDHSAITDLTATASIPGNFPGRFTFVVPDGFTPEERLRMRLTYVDHDFFSSMKIDLVEGRDFMPNSEQDRNESAIVNQAAFQAYGWEGIEGKYLNFGSTRIKVIGVVEDYNFESLANEVAPIIHFYRPSENAVHALTVARVAPGRTTDALAVAREQWEAALPSVPFDYYFLDERFQQQYESEERLTGAISTFSIVAIIIATMGLLGLSSLITAQRTKEIGIRKVLGASVLSIMTLLSQRFALLIGLAFVLTVPLASILLGNWLSDFAYRINLGAMVFLVALLGTLFVAIAAISLQTAKAALANPIKSMRYE
ncbi:ABC transporter permease [Roseivirga sp.]|uniref:ABC transporter permease n=1 Tax=Roseivirga sp. TaxID=1964215 RepID=UPI003B51C87E